VPVQDPSNENAPFMTTNNVSCFTNLCYLSEICAEIMSSFYTANVTRRPQTRLQEARESIRARLTSWLTNLPDVLRLTPWDDDGQAPVSIYVIML
jgi:hypothetical protein